MLQSKLEMSCFPASTWAPFERVRLIEKWSEVPWPGTCEHRCHSQLIFLATSSWHISSRKCIREQKCWPKMQGRPPVKKYSLPTRFEANPKQDVDLVVSICTSLLPVSLGAGCSDTELGTVHVTLGVRHNIQALFGVERPGLNE